MNPYLANLMQKIGPMLAAMPNLQRQGMFGPGMAPPMRRQMPTMPNIPMPMQRRRQFGQGMMPRLNPAQFTPAFNNTPGFAPPPSAGPAAPFAAPAATPAGGNPFTGYTGGPLNPAQIAANSGWTPQLGNLFDHNA